MNNSIIIIFTDEEQGKRSPAKFDGVGGGCSIETDFLPLYITSVYKVLQHLLLIINLNLLAAQLYWLTSTKLILIL